MLHKYALSDYQLSIALPTDVTDALGLDESIFTIGGTGDNGEGSFLGELTAERENDTINTVADATGSWVHNKSRAINGTISLKIRQVSDDVIKLINLCNYYYDSFADGVTLSITKAGSDIVRGVDCYIKKMPGLDYVDTAGELTWDFTCGQVLFVPKGENI